MGKFPFKRPRIISKKFPGMTSSIDGVTKSLNDLVFSYRDHVEKALQKKHLMMAISSLVLLIVLGSFISPKGKAESSIFYPDTCLGGWVNPSHAQGEQETSSNGDESQFTKDNSAVLPKNTDAEMYCGNFKGTFDSATKPTKIIVSLALTKGEDILLQEMVPSDSSASSTASSTKDILDNASTTDFSLILATSTATSTIPASSTPAINSDVVATSTNASTTPGASSTAEIVPPPVVSPEVPPSVVEGVIDSLKEGIMNLFGNTKNAPQETDTVVVPPPVEKTEEPPTSYLLKIKENLLSYFLERAFAEEDETSTTTEDVPSVSSSTDIVIATSSEIITIGTTTMGTSTLSEATSTVVDIGTSTLVTASTTGGNQFQNNFLEVFYTFDGVTWTSLGELNEISMKYRTFEIPVTASTSWSDMSQLQIKIIAKKHFDETPTVYLDGIKVEVLYETTLSHVHPDFARDTILKDEIVDGVRVLTIINNDTKLEEIWYMYLEDGASTSYTPIATSTIGTSTLPSVIASSTEGTTTQESSSYVLQSNGTTSPESNASSTLSVVDLLKRTWKKYEGKETSLPASEIVEEIKKQEEQEKIKEEEAKDILPDFASDTLKRMKGVFSHLVLVQIERSIGTTTDSGEAKRNELWLYDLENSTEEKIGSGTSTELVTIAPDSPLGVKGGYLFWLSLDKKTLYAYGFDNKMILTQHVPSFRPSDGERAEIHFAETPWKVIVSNEGFSFYSTETGEVFSDEDSRITEKLRIKMGLDEVLDKDELSNLSLPVEAEQ